MNPQTTAPDAGGDDRLIASAPARVGTSLGDARAQLAALFRDHQPTVSEYERITFFAALAAIVVDAAHGAWEGDRPTPQQERRDDYTQAAASYGFVLGYAAARCRPAEH